MKRTIIGIGVLVSIIGFILAVVSVTIETNIHKEIRDNKSDGTEYNDLMYRKSIVSSFAEIGIFLGFLLMNSVVIYHLREQF